MRRMLRTGILTAGLLVLWLVLTPGLVTDSDASPRGGIPQAPQSREEAPTGSSAGVRALPGHPDWESPEEDHTRSLSWGDWDNDGDLDLAVGNSGEPNRVYASVGNSLTLVWSSKETEDTWSVAWGDWDNDGDLDLAVGNFSQANRVYENTGGTLASVWTSTETDQTYSVAWGDWDNDGDLDLAAGNRHVSNRVYENTGGALTLDWSSTETDATYSVAWGDWDNDGDLELAAGNAAGQPNRVYVNSGGALSLGWSSIETDATYGVAWGDWNRDGNLDLAVANSGEPSRVYNNTGGALTLYQSTPDVSRSVGVAWGNWDGDDYLELATANLGQANRVYDVEPYGIGIKFETVIMDDTSDVALADFDGDGIHDLTTGNSGGSNRIYRGLGGSYSAYSVDLSSVRALAWGDWDGDGDLDLLTAYSYLWLWENTDTDFAWTWVSDEPEQARSVAWGDWDADGDLDLAVGNYGEPNRVYENEGGFLERAWSSVETDLTQGVAWGDWDGDGDLDLAVGNQHHAEPNRVYENVGASLELAWSAAETDVTADVAWGDWDGDGDLDLAIGTELGPNRVYENTGGTLSSAWIAPEAEFTTSVAWGDWDGDGDLDLAVGNHGQPDRVYENTGGALTSAWTSPESIKTTGVAWGDWDGDGDMDLVVSSKRPAECRVYIRTPGQLLFTWALDSLDPLIPEGLALGDWDADGDLDLAVAGSFSSAVIENHRLSRPGGLPETPVHPVALDRPGATDTAYFFSSAECLTSPVSIPYTLYDEQSDPAPSIVPQYSLVGGGHWLPATEGPGGDGTTDLAASPEGTPHTFSWDYAADTTLPASAVFRITVSHQAPDHAGQPIQNGSLSAVSPPFRINMDSDGDGLLNCEDNCPEDPNPNQEDADGDGVGDPCDNCPDFHNPDQQLASLGDRVWRDADTDGIQDFGEFGFEDIPVILYDAGMSVVDTVPTGINGRYAFDELCPGDYTIDVVPPAGMSFTGQDVGGDDAIDSDVDPATGRVAVTLNDGDERTDVDAGLLGECLGPEEAAYIYGMTLTDDENRYPVLHFRDSNPPAEVTGYNVYRSGDPDLPHASWSQIGLNVTDMILGAPTNQWIDQSTAQLPGGIWFYQVAVFNSACGSEGPW